MLYGIVCIQIVVFEGQLENDEEGEEGQEEEEEEEEEEERSRFSHRHAG